MVKASLISIAALTVVDAIATGGHYRGEVTHACLVFVRAVAGMGWSMVLS